MKKFIALLIACFMLFAVAGCGDPRAINGKHYDTVGFVDQMEGNKDPCIKYELSMGNVIWAIVLVEMIVPTVYFIGWSLFNPISAKPGCEK